MAADGQPDILGIFARSNQLLPRFVTMFGKHEVLGNDFCVARPELIIHELAKFAETQKQTLGFLLEACERFAVGRLVEVGIELCRDGVRDDNALESSETVADLTHDDRNRNL